METISTSALRIAIAVVPLITTAVVVHLSGASHVRPHGEIAERLGILFGSVPASVAPVALTVVLVIVSTLAVVVVVLILVMSVVIAAVLVVRVVRVGVVVSASEELVIVSSSKPQRPYGSGTYDSS